MALQTLLTPTRLYPLPHPVGRPNSGPVLAHCRPALLHGHQVGQWHRHGEGGGTPSALLQNAESYCPVRLLLLGGMPVSLRQVQMISVGCASGGGLLSPETCEEGEK